MWSMYCKLDQTPWQVFMSPSFCWYGLWLTQTPMKSLYFLRGLDWMEWDQGAVVRYKSAKIIIDKYFSAEER